MKIGEIKDLTHDQLDDELVKLKKEQFNLRFQQASGQLEKAARITQVRKIIARIKTVQRQMIKGGAMDKKQKAEMAQPKEK